MNKMDFKCKCPKCGETYNGNIDLDMDSNIDNVLCRKCGHEYKIKVDVIVDVTIIAI